MNMSEWARKEVEIACAKANDEEDDGWDGYISACYRSALKAFNSLMEDNHSGMSFSYTTDILDRLMRRRPLTPIEDVPENWQLIHSGILGENTYACTRMSGLYKRIKADGSIVYNDNNRVIVHDTVTGTTWHNGMASEIVDEMFPITFPYYPANKPYKLEGSEYLTDKKYGDFDTIAFMKLISPDGNVIQINRYFGETDNGWRELTIDEFNDRYAMHCARERKENK